MNGFIGLLAVMFGLSFTAYANANLLNKDKSPNQNIPAVNQSSPSLQHNDGTNPSNESNDDEDDYEDEDDLSQDPDPEADVNSGDTTTPSAQAI